MRHDRARIQIGKISRFGLLETVAATAAPVPRGSDAIDNCPRCSGAGNIRSVESLALAILRLVGEEARKERTAKVIAQLPMDVANYMLNEKRDWVQTLQDANGVTVVLLGNPDLETPNYSLRRVRDDEAGLAGERGQRATSSSIRSRIRASPTRKSRRHRKPRKPRFRTSCRHTGAHTALRA